MKQSTSHTNTYVARCAIDKRYIRYMGYDMVARPRQGEIHLARSRL